MNMAEWRWDKVDKGLYRHGRYEIAHEKDGWTCLDSGMWVGTFETMEEAKDRAVARFTGNPAQLTSPAVLGGEPGVIRLTERGLTEGDVDHALKLFAGRQLCERVGLDDDEAWGDVLLDEPFHLPSDPHPTPHHRRLPDGWTRHGQHL